MRILYNSRQEQFKTPFGTLRTGESCVLHIQIPTTVKAVGVQLVLEDCDEGAYGTHAFVRTKTDDTYETWRCEFSLPERGLYFYWFRIEKAEGSFRLFRQGDGTNMEAGEKWQISSIPAGFTVPEYAKGAVMYQIFPDRFYKSGECDLREKLRPFSIHENWDDMPSHTADKEGNWCSDFFGGNLAGVREKLPYLQELGVKVLYFNPIFMAYSNHRYDTADYKRIDPMLGTEEDFRLLCADAHERGMRVVLDGVFSHTGSNSVYFDAKHIFGNGAVSNPDSPYRDWYHFSHYPDRYEAWWGMPTLPNVEETAESYMNYIIDAEDSVAAHWLRLGADGFRLDVVDELPDVFVNRLKKRIRQIKPDALLLGEVWEDASNKRAYGVSRRYFVDEELDSVMNYPWRKAIIDFVLGKDDGTAFGESIMTLAENYPTQVLSCVMNLLSSHDTIRILTVLGEEYPETKEARGKYQMSEQLRQKAIQRLQLAAFLQFTLPGMPSIYYGDEAGLDGFEDPFCRRCYPWGQEDEGLRSYFAALCRLKNECSALREGTIHVTQAGKGILYFERKSGEQLIRICANNSHEFQKMPEGYTLRFGRDLVFDGRDYWLEQGGFCLLERSLDGC